MTKARIIILALVAALTIPLPAFSAEPAATDQDAKTEKKAQPGDDDETIEKLQNRVKTLEAKVATLEGLVSKLSKGRRFVGPKQVWESGSTRIELSPMGVSIKSPSGVLIDSGGGIDVKSRAGITVAGNGTLNLKGSTIRLNNGGQGVLRGPVKIRNTCIPNRATGAFHCADGIVEPGSQSRSVFVD
ncbi:MAG: hypothetical protein KIT00_00345 [Rhodospirillales bacterium]|nr:hypothetical protein [Rhodospirillales bacterium]